MKHWQTNELPRIDVYGMLTFMGLFASREQLALTGGREGASIYAHIYVHIFRNASASEIDI